MTLDEAIKELHRVTPADEPWTGEDVVYDHDREPDNIDHAIAAILNAVIAGELRKETEVQALVEALRFYADPTLDGYDVHVTDYGLSTDDGHIIKDGGEKARAALTAWENKDAK